MEGPGEKSSGPFGVFVLFWSLYLDWLDGYSRRGMEAVAFLLMWGVAAISFLFGLCLYNGGENANVRPWQGGKHSAILSFFIFPLPMDNQYRRAAVCSGQDA